METLNLNQNLFDCVKSIDNIGETLYQNICNGSIAIVPWGIINWLLFGFLVVVTIFAIWSFISITLDN